LTDTGKKRKQKKWVSQDSEGQKRGEIWWWERTRRCCIVGNLAKKCPSSGLQNKHSPATHKNSCQHTMNGKKFMCEVSVRLITKANLRRPSRKITLDENERSIGTHFYFFISGSWL